MADASRPPVPPSLEGLAEQIALRLHLKSDHYRDVGGPMAPDEYSSFLCDCRMKAAHAVDAIDAHMLALFASYGEAAAHDQVEEQVRAQISDWLSASADRWEQVASDAQRAHALRWAARQIQEHADRGPR